MQQNLLQGMKRMHDFSYFFAEESYSLQSLQRLLILISRVRHTLSTLNSCLPWTENGQMKNRNLQKNLYSGALQYEGNVRKWNSAWVGFISLNLGVYNVNIFMGSM